MSNDKRTTRQRILDESLKLFSKYGFSGVSVEMIAGAVGIKGSSLYKHFSSKQEIFDEIFNMMEMSYADIEVSLGIPQTFAKVVDFYNQSSREALVDISVKLFEYLTHNEKEVQFRHLLMIEQFGSERIAEKYFYRYYKKPIEFQTSLFENMEGNSNFNLIDVELLAVEFFAPILTFISMCDTLPSFETKAISLLKEHVNQFHSIYFDEVEG